MCNTAHTTPIVITTSFRRQHQSLLFLCFASLAIAEKRAPKMARLARVWHNMFTFRKPLLGHGVVAASCFSTLGAKRVGTHSGTFHCDEALACFMLRLSQHFSNAYIVRTRDPKVVPHSSSLFFLFYCYYEFFWLILFWCSK